MLAVLGAFDRRVALITFVLSSVVVLTATALTDIAIETTPERDDPYAFVRLLVAARAADATSVEIEIDVVRTIGDEVQSAIVRRARTPNGSVEWTEESATLRRDGREWNCFTVADDWECVETTETSPPRSLGTPGLYGAAAASGDYRFVDLGARRVGSRDARCGRVVLVGSRPVAGVGILYEACFAPGGPMLWSYHERPGNTEEQTVRSVTVIDDDDLADRFAEASRGLVTLDDAPIP